jgi:hypothetical protein
MARKIANPNKMRTTILERERKAIDKHNSLRAKRTAQLELDYKNFVNAEIERLQQEHKRLEAGSDPDKHQKQKLLEELIDHERKVIKFEKSKSNYQEDINKQQRILEFYRRAFELAGNPKTRKLIKNMLMSYKLQKKKKI